MKQSRNTISDWLDKYRDPKIDKQVEKELQEIIIKHQREMTPKEKAKELFDKYATCVVMWTGGIEVEKQNCKMCALIAVDEIINYLPRKVTNSHLWYWQEVKQEIQNL